MSAALGARVALAVLLGQGVPKAPPSTPPHTSAPTPAAQQRAAASAEATWVEVRGPRQATGPGMRVSAQGHVLTAVNWVGLERAQIRDGQKWVPAVVTYADARLGLALVRSTDEASHAESVRPAVPVRLEPLVHGERLIALRRGKDAQLHPKLVRVLGRRGRHVLMDQVLLPGSPLLDAQGRLVAVAVRGGRAAGVSELRRALAAWGTDAP